MSGSYFRLSGDENFYRHYLIIQKKISQIIPREYKRPIIEFHIRGSEWKDGDPICNIVGGMGPVSDSQLIDKVLTSADGATRSIKQFHVKLLSIPPPRSAVEFLCGGLRYFWRLSTFLQEPCDGVYLASNTTHIYLPMFRALSAAPVIDMTEKVANYIVPLQSRKQSANQQAQRVLILGTLAGHKNQLYESKLRERDIQFLTLSLDD